MSRVATPAKRAPAKPKSRRRGGPTLFESYLVESRTPLTSLLFILPLLVLHEVGIGSYGRLSDGGIEFRVTAFTLFTRFLHSCGAGGRYLPALGIVVILLCIHVAHRDRWVFNIPFLPVMAVESLAWAAPLAGVYFLFSPTAPTYSFVGDPKLAASLYLGAGIYEEAIFRLGGFALLSFALIDLARISPRKATPCIVVIAALTFSAYHILGCTSVSWQVLVFTSLRGVYYGIIFLERGFGVTVGVHTAYDLTFLALREVNAH